MIDKITTNKSFIKHKTGYYRKPPINYTKVLKLAPHTHSKL